MESKCKTRGSHLLSEVGPTACRCVQCLLQMQLKKHITFCHPVQQTYCSRTINFGQHRIILSADTASEVRQLLSQKRR